MMHFSTMYYNIVVWKFVYVTISGHSQSYSRGKTLKARGQYFHSCQCRTVSLLESHKAQCKTYICIIYIKIIVCNNNISLRNLLVLSVQVSHALVKQHASVVIGHKRTRCVNIAMW